MNEKKDYYELYRRSTLGVTLLDSLDELITARRIEPQLAMKILSNFDKCMTEVLADKVKSRLSFKVCQVSNVKGRGTPCVGMMLSHLIGSSGYLSLL